MLSWGLRTLWRDRRYAMTASLGVAAALLLVLLVEGMFVGESRQITAYPGDLGADLWVAQDGVSNMHMATSFIDAGKEIRINRLPGVASTSSLLYVNGFVSDGEWEWFAYIVGIRGRSPDAGPGVSVRGKRLPDSGEAVIPEVLADRAGVDIGDRIRVANEPVRIVGIMDGYFSMANSIVFVEAGWLADVLDIFDMVSYVVIRAEPGADVTGLARTIRDELEGVEVVENQTFLANDRRIGLQMGGELIAIMAVVSAVVAALLVAWCVTVMINRYQQELAVAKALGALDVQVIAAVACQVVLVTASGYLVSLGAGVALEPLMHEWTPGVAVHFPAGSYIRNGVLSLGIAFAAMALPVSRVVRVDPAAVFR